MKPREILCCCVVALTGWACPAFADGPNPLFAGQVIVRLAPNCNCDIDAFITQCEAENSAIGLDLTVVEVIDDDESTYLLEFDPTGLSTYELTQLASNLDEGYLGGLLQWGGFAHDVRGPEGGTGSIWFYVDTEGPQHFQDQFASAALGLGAAHVGSTGQGMVVAVLDTGVDATHPALQGRVLDNGYNFIDGNTITSDVADGVTNDLVGHGTFVASLITFVAPDALILPIRVLNGDGRGSDWTVAMGIQYAIDHGVEVINLSLVSTHESDAIEDAIERAADVGIVTVSAAGNLGASDPLLLLYPAADSMAISVAATDEQDIKAAFSSFNEDVAITAPGANMPLAANPLEPDPQHSIIGAMAGGGYAMWEGTSFATALVSGGAALIRAQHPEWPNDDGVTDSIGDVLESTSVDISMLNPMFYSPYELLGDGRMDLAAAVGAAPPAPTPGDLDNDGTVGITDFLTMLSAWNLVHSSADLNGDGTVGITDLLILLGNWG